MEYVIELSPKVQFAMICFCVIVAGFACGRLIRILR